MAKIEYPERGTTANSVKVSCDFRSSENCKEDYEISKKITLLANDGRFFEGCVDAYTHIEFITNLIE